MWADGPRLKLRQGRSMWTVMNPASARRAPYPVRTAHKQCMKCGKLLSRAAFACRRCGKRQRIRPRTMVLVASGCLLIGMFAIASASALLTPPPAIETAPAWPKMAAAPAIPAASVQVTATELWAEYARDGSGANRKFKDKAVAVTGLVRSVERDFEGNMVARLATGDAFETVNAKLATRSDPSLVGVVKGRSASLLCVGRGALMGSPQLAGCFVR